MNHTEQCQNNNKIIKPTKQMLKCMKTLEFFMKRNYCFYDGILETG